MRLLEGFWGHFGVAAACILVPLLLEVRVQDVTHVASGNSSFAGLVVADCVFVVYVTNVACLCTTSLLPVVILSLQCCPALMLHVSRSCM